MMLEQQMQELRELPARVAGVESQIVQLRAEMRDGFSAIRDELRGEMHRLNRESRDDFRAGLDETHRFMRVLHEEVIRRIAIGREGQSGDR